MILHCLSLGKPTHVKTELANASHSMAVQLYVCALSTSFFESTPTWVASLIIMEFMVRSVEEMHGVDAQNLKTRNIVELYTRSNAARN